ncbi:MAG TPA: IcmT/TraK family protein [Alphaproteobacteria bacterium]|nr:IcmT/TraK family protein [Alphaproteobacteria bacterium]
MDIHWRNTQKPARFFALDARAFAAILLFLLHARLWTFILAIVVMFVFWLLERRGLTFEASLRALRSWVLGRKRPANHRRANRHWIDFG